MEKLECILLSYIPYARKPVDAPSKLYGLLSRRERWGLTARGWLLVVSSVSTIIAVLFFCSYPFLALSRPVQSDVLVVEGWIHEYAIRAAISEFHSSRYDRLFTTGGPIEGYGGYVNDYNTAASVGAELLKKNGLPSDKIQMVPCRISSHDRTYSSAVALRDWFLDHNHPIPDSFNVLTEDLHARRSRLLFQKAFGSSVRVGVIGIPPRDYAADRWWRYSAGVKDLISEMAAYLYARLFFWPSLPEI